MRVYAPIIITIWFSVAACAAELPKPPIFGHPELTGPAEAVTEAWTHWDRLSHDFEREALAMPRSEGRERVRRAYAALLEYMEARRLYSEALRSALESHVRTAAVTVSAVSSDQLDLLGAQLSDIQKRLEALRSAPEWITLRRGVQKERDAIDKLEESRRERIQDGLLTTHTETSEVLTPSAYQDSDREVRAAIADLWTHYCQTLLNIIYQQPENSTSPEVQLAMGQPINSEPTGATRLEGAWTYSEGSRKFDGAAEPKHVVLELWLENGLLRGRYRADIQMAAGTRHLDLNLTGKPSARRNQTFDFRSTDPPTTGTVTLQPAANGIELTFIRPSGNAYVPSGREVLTRR